MLENKTAFITGASQGIGQKIATKLADKGANVALAARSDGIFETAELISDEDRTVTVQTDVTEEESVKSSIESTVDKFGGLDFLINNAGIAGPTSPVEEVKAEEWEKTMDVNVKGMFFCTKHSVPYLKKSDRASIVNISSISGKRPLKNRTPYTASKMAVIGFTRTLAFELGEDGITVNAICPGATKGPRVERVIENQADKLGLSYEEAKQKVFTDDAALGILVEAEDIANQVAYLVGAKGKHITAQDINVDGGQTWY